MLIFHSSDHAVDGGTLISCLLIFIFDIHNKTGLKVSMFVVIIGTRNNNIEAGSPAHFEVWNLAIHSNESTCIKAEILNNFSF